MSHHYDERDRTIALAGIFQAAQLVTELARRGQCESRGMRASIDSLFEFEPPSTEAVYGGTAGLTAGLRALAGQLDEPGQRDLEVARYVVALVSHADRLLRDRERLDALGHDLEMLREKCTLFELADFSRAAHLARLYQQHISPVPPQIMVRGEPLHLQNPQIAERIRCLLLAGIRAAVLWRQCGGKRWRLITKRRKIAGIARDLLEP